MLWLLLAAAFPSPAAPLKSRVEPDPFDGAPTFFLPLLRAHRMLMTEGDFGGPGIRASVGPTGLAFLADFLKRELSGMLDARGARLNFAIDELKVHDDYALRLSVPGPAHFASLVGRNGGSRISICGGSPRAWSPG